MFSSSQNQTMRVVAGDSRCKTFFDGCFIHSIISSAIYLSNDNPTEFFRGRDNAYAITKV